MTSIIVRGFSESPTQTRIVFPKLDKGAIGEMGLRWTFTALHTAKATEGTIKLAHASAVHRLKQGPDKTDHGDAWRLANLIRVNYLPEVWLADEITRQLRHLVRFRQSLMADAKDIKLRIRSLLKEDLVTETYPQGAWTKAWLEWVKEVPLPEHSRWILDQQLALLNHLQKKIDDVDNRMKEATQDDPLVQKLLAQAGVGLVTAMLLRAVVGRFDRFNNGKQLSRYCGVTPPAVSDKRIVGWCLPDMMICALPSFSWPNVCHDMTITGRNSKNASERENLPMWYLRRSPIAG